MSVAAAAADSATAAPIRQDRLYLGSWLEAAVYDETAITPGAVLAGPSVVELPDTNIVVGPDQRATVDQRGNVVITPDS